MRNSLRAALTLALFVWGGVAHGSTCQTLEFEGQPFTACEVQKGEDLRLFLRGPDGAILGSFAGVNTALGPDQMLGFAMNAGMYHADRAPVGLYIENGTEQVGIVTREGPGNFGMLPNGVFCVGDGFAVLESRAYAAAPPDCRFATQSGPLLVQKGALHPRFLADSDSLNIRNGVGVSEDGTRAVFVISDTAVNFHLFARVFRDALGLPDALYFDGKISRLYAPDLGRNDAGFPMGPIIGTVVPKAN